MLLGLYYRINSYQFGFLLSLFCLGVWVVKCGVTPAMAATQIRSGFVFEPYGAPSALGPKRHFTFMEGGTVSLAPSRLQGEDRYDYYAALAAHHGREPVRTTVIGLRGLTPNGRRHDSADNMSNYDDTFVVLQPSSRQAREFLGATHAGQAVSSLSPDGVAQIQPGLYQAEPVGDFNGMASWWVTDGWGDGRVPCWRDANGDGLIAGEERWETLTATEILFHNGRQDDYGTSIGCQVLPPAGMLNFIRTVGPSETFDYVLIDANQPLERSLNG